jgi:hypothetical protein
MTENKRIIWKIEKRKLKDLKPHPNNPRQFTEKGMKDLENSINSIGFMQPININQDGTILSGHARTLKLKEMGEIEVDVYVPDRILTPKQEEEVLIRANANTAGQWDWDLLANEFDLEEINEWGLEIPDMEVEELEDKEDEKPKKLADRFIIPPFSVLDTKQGAWQQRKNYWLSLGIKSEEGRSAAVGGSKMVATYQNGKRETGLVTETDTSIFDPVLCELAYKWFNVPNGNILDPFAGGSVRGIVAAKLDYQYLGNDLSQKQIDANRINAKEVLQYAEIYPTWTCGDSLKIDTIAKDYKADLVFSCPPYADLEVYSDAKEDISNMPYNEFLKIYREIIRKSCDMLKQDRFAVFVVGDVRDKKGFYQNFVSDTIKAFIDCGVILYNEMILVNAVGSLAIRAGRQFSAGRKVGKQHQNVLVFYKGNPKNIKANYPELDLSYIEEQETENN